jgi:hypothetical protein
MPGATASSGLVRLDKCSRSFGDSCQRSNYRGRESFIRDLLNAMASSAARMAYDREWVCFQAFLEVLERSEQTAGIC